jgi:hypothetical protein
MDDDEISGGERSQELTSWLVLVVLGLIVVVGLTLLALRAAGAS